MQTDTRCPHCMTVIPLQVSEFFVVVQECPSCYRQLYAAEVKYPFLQSIKIGSATPVLKEIKKRPKHLRVIEGGKNG